MAVRSLHAATAGQLGHLKEGEQEKQKSYMAVCWLSRPLTDADVALLGATRELEVQQQTPIRVRRQERRRLPAARSQLALAGDATMNTVHCLRLRCPAACPPQVLHRRANLGRPKVVHEMHAEPLAGQSPHYFALRLRTQAGAYIKEFVHGELYWLGVKSNQLAARLSNVQRR